jgi:hypothetical protein
VHKIQWTSSSPATGVTLLGGVYADPNANPYWTVTIQAPVQSPFGGSVEEAEAGSPTWARQTEASLAADGFDPVATVLPWPNYADDPRGVMGVRVRVGQFAAQAEASGEAATLTGDGFAPLVEWTGFDPQPGPDAELLHVAVVDPRHFAGQVIAYHGSAVASRETVPAASAALNSVVATNGGFFTIDAALAAVGGVNTGLSVYNGQIESLANGDRAALVLDGHRPAQIENLTSLADLRAGGSSIQILGINRLPGSAEDCGVTGFTPTNQPRQNTLCTGANDIVLFTPMFEASLPPRPELGPGRAGDHQFAGAGRVRRDAGRDASGRRLRCAGDREGCGMAERSCTGGPADERLRAAPDRVGWPVPAELPDEHRQRRSDPATPRGGSDRCRQRGRAGPARSQ